MSSSRGWTEEDIQYVMKYYGRVPTNDIGQHLNKSRSCVKDKAHALGLTRKQKKWKATDDDFINNNLDKGHDWIAEQLGVNKQILIRHIRFMKDKDVIESNKISNHYKTHEEEYLDISDVRYITGIKNFDFNDWEKIGLTVYVIDGRKYVKEKHLILFMKNHPDIWLCRKCAEWFFGGSKWFIEKAIREQHEYLKQKWGIEA